MELPYRERRVAARSVSLTVRGKDIGATQLNSDICKSLEDTRTRIILFLRRDHDGVSIIHNVSCHARLKENHVERRRGVWPKYISRTHILSIVQVHFAYEVHGRFNCVFVLSLHTISHANSTYCDNDCVSRQTVIVAVNISIWRKSGVA